MTYKGELMQNNYNIIDTNIQINVKFDLDIIFIVAYTAYSLLVYFLKW